MQGLGDCFPGSDREDDLVGRDVTAIIRMKLMGLAEKEQFNVY
jgi:hypothetical protein